MARNRRDQILMIVGLILLLIGIGIAFLASASGMIRPAVSCISPTGIDVINPFVWLSWLFCVFGNAFGQLIVSLFSIGGFIMAIIIAIVGLALILRGANVKLR